MLELSHTKIVYERGGEKMEEKKTIKISLVTFFLIIAIIVICIMGYFLYVSNTKTNDMISKEKELNEKISKLEDDIASKQTQIIATTNNANSGNTKTNEIGNTSSNNSSVENNLTFSSLSGEYIGDAKVEPGTTPDGETKVYLYLYEDGGFCYNNSPGLGSGIVGYYTFDGNELFLHEVVGIR